MPAPGDQHNSRSRPFEAPQQRMYEYSREEIAILQSRLEKQLGPEFLSERNGNGQGKLHYITGDKCIALANDIFGFNGWSSSIVSIETDYFEEDRQSKRANVGIAVVVRVTLRDGTYHEDVGYGIVANGQSKGTAFQKAKKEGTTDALKRALRQFGNVLGNCLYDKTYLSKVTKIKTTPPKFDESRLHRHPDYVVKKEAQRAEEPKKEQPAMASVQPPPPQLPTAESFEDFLDELDEADFINTDDSNPDEIALPDSSETKSNQFSGSNVSHNQPKNGGNNPMQPPARQLARTSSAGNNPPRQAPPVPQTPVQPAAKSNPNNFPGAAARGPPAAARPPQQFNQARPAPQASAQPQPKPNNANQNQNRNHNQNQNQNHNHNHNHNQNQNQNPNQNNNQIHSRNPQDHMTPPPAGHAMVNMEPPAGEAGFLSARAIKSLPEKALEAGEFDRKPAHVFNPRLESPSIRRTPGVDHSATKPVTRSGQHVPGKKTEEVKDDDNDNATAAAAVTTGGGGGGGAGSGQGFTGAPRPSPTAAPGGGGGGGGAAAALRTGNMLNPQLDHSRRIGAPISSSPLGNRGQFRPPTIKRPAGGDGTVRVPLEDVSNAPLGAGGGMGGGGLGVKGPDLKRQRTS